MLNIQEFRNNRVSYIFFYVGNTAVSMTLSSVEKRVLIFVCELLYECQCYKHVYGRGRAILILFYDFGTNRRGRPMSYHTLVGDRCGKVNLELIVSYDEREFQWLTLPSYLVFSMPLFISYMSLLLSMYFFRHGHVLCILQWATVSTIYWIGLQYVGLILVVKKGLLNWWN